MSPNEPRRSLTCGNAASVERLALAKFIRIGEGRLGVLTGLGLGCVGRRGGRSVVPAEPCWTVLRSWRLGVVGKVMLVVALWLVQSVGPWALYLETERSTTLGRVQDAAIGHEVGQDAAADGGVGDDARGLDNQGAGAVQGDGGTWPVGGDVRMAAGCVGRSGSRTGSDSATALFTPVSLSFDRRFFQLPKFPLTDQ